MKQGYPTGTPALLACPVGASPGSNCRYGVKVCCSTTVPGGCSTVIVALVKATSVISASQRLFGQPPSLPVGSAGAPVTTLNVTLPFLISLAGMLCVPVRVTDPGFCPGASLPPGLVQVVVGVPAAVRVTVMFSLPRPESAPEEDNVRPLSVKVGSALPGLKFTAALATAAVIATSSSDTTAIMPNFLNIKVFLLYLVGIYCSLRTGACLRHCLRAVECLFAGAGRSCVSPYIAKQASGPLPSYDFLLS